MYSMCKLYVSAHFVCCEEGSFAAENELSLFHVAW